MNEPLLEAQESARRWGRYCSRLSQKLRKSNEEIDKLLRKNQALLQDLTLLVCALESSNIICKLCKHHYENCNDSCPSFIQGDTMTNPETNESFNIKWTCQDFDFGTCDVLEHTPCNGCYKGSNWEWRGVL